MDVVTVSETFNCTAEQLWNALTEEQQLKKWYFSVQDFELKEGHTFTFYESETSQKYLHRCRFIKIVPNQLLEHSWEHPSHSKGTSVLKWEVTPLNDTKTLLILTHSGLENFADGGSDFNPENYKIGWETIIKESLKNYIKTI